MTVYNLLGKIILIQTKQKTMKQAMKAPQGTFPEPLQAEVSPGPSPIMILSTLQ